MIDTLAALGRMSVSLVAVVGLIWLISRWMRTKAKAGATGPVAVLSRTSVGHKAGVAVVRVGDRALVVGVTEQQVTLLTDVPLEVVAPEQTPAHTTIEIPAQSTAAFSAELALQSSAADADVEVITHTDAAGGATAPKASGTGTGRPAALTGSALSPATWAQALQALRERTTQR